jgi:4-hydroxybenzoate polyprenyltransferase
MKVAASLVVMGLAAAGVVEWQGWPREAALFALVTAAALGGLCALQVTIGRRLDALDERTKRPRP